MTPIPAGEPPPVPCYDPAVSDRLSRREFVARSALYGGVLWAGLSLPRPETLRAAASSTEPVTFDREQWQLVEALTARIIPTDHQPGAREANCVNFIDKALAHEDAQARPVYELGLAGVELASAKRHGKRFVELSEAEQDELLVSFETGTAEGWPKPPTPSIPSPVFFETLRAQTLIGFLAEPRYGGNHDYAGWRVTGHPGPRHHAGGYTPAQMLGEAPIRPVWEKG
jgi:gluconate 2-dehydrogenase gamma chain